MQSFYIVIIFTLRIMLGFNTENVIKTIIKHYASVYGIREEIALAVAYKETRFQFWHVSKTEDYGLFQIHCGKKWSWCRHFGISKNEIMNPVINTITAMRIMKICKGAWKKKKKDK